MSTKPDGGPAYPVAFTTTPLQGMSLRDYFAAIAPIDFALAAEIWGDPDVNLNDDKTRAVFFSVWALLRYEYADEMLAERAK